MIEKKAEVQTQKKQKPLAEQFKKINGDAAIGVMRHKDGTIEKRKM